MLRRASKLHGFARATLHSSAHTTGAFHALARVQSRALHTTRDVSSYTRPALSGHRLVKLPSAVRSRALLEQKRLVHTSRISLDNMSNRRDDDEDEDDFESEENAVANLRLPKLRDVLAVPTLHRPLFPGTSVPMVIHDPAVVARLSAEDNLEAKFVGVFMKKQEFDAAEPSNWGKPEIRKEEGGVAASGSRVAEMDELHDIGMYAQVRSLNRSQDQSNEGSRELVLFGLHRIRKVKELDSNDVLRVRIEHLDEHAPEFVDEEGSFDAEEHEDEPSNEDVVRAYTLEIMQTLREIITLNPLSYEQITYFLQNADLSNPSMLADHAAWICSTIDAQQLQEILETIDVSKRVHLSLLVVKKELEVIHLQKHIEREVHAKNEQLQKQMLLREQLKEIKKQLGLERDDKDSLMEKYQARLVDKTLPEEAERVIKEEMEKFSSLENSSMEFNITRNYLDWLTILPWGQQTLDNFDIAFAEKALNEDHYGMQDVKERILEFIAVGSLMNARKEKLEKLELVKQLEQKLLAASAEKTTAETLEAEAAALDADVDATVDAPLEENTEVVEEVVKAVDALQMASGGKIICLVGPPGVGKTSIGKSVARSINRQFYRFSVGGMSDVAEIKGHRRTYVGAMPGKLVQCLKKVETQNPVIMIDEVDKIGKGYQGDPASALLEVLDPEQNFSFLDHYLDVPVDLSNVLFICTANDQSTIPGPLADRMDFIRLSGYVDSEKVEIVKQYLEPATLRKTGIEPGTVELEPAAVRDIIRWYCREAGVRNLQKHIEKVYRKVALELVRKQVQASVADTAVDSNSTVVEENAAAIIITPENLKDYLGKAKFTQDRLYERTPVGVVMGLAWNSMGGATLYIEATAADIAVSSSLAQNIVGEDIEGELLAETTEVEDDVAAEVDAGNSGGLFSTGQLGDVMKESTLIAYTVAKAFLNKVDPSNKFFSTTRIHLHVPEGATPKDGPSAGVTMVTSLLSLALNTPIVDLGMTGEITLTQKVLPIGGVKEKTIAAKRSRVSTLCFPKQNERDWDELDEDIKEGVTVHFVDTYADLFPICFPEFQAKTEEA